MNGNILTYNIADFGTVNFNSDFAFVVQTDTIAQIGDQVCFDVTVDPFAGDNDTTNNFYAHCFNVVNSYDPNDKQVYPSGMIDPSTEWLNYTIRFQNTGNAPAQHIYILDTLDNNIDVSSIQLLSYSHEPIVQVVGGIVRFNFPNINLPDSVSNEPNSHGYVQYKVKLKTNLPLGTQVNNTAYIYFDFNAPVQTNTASNIIDIVTAINTVKLNELISVYPNPVKSNSILHITSIRSLKNVELALINVTGRKVFSVKLNSSNSKDPVQLPSLTSGIYQVIVSDGKTLLNQKIVITE